jgi:hypothetical protein
VSLANTFKCFLINSLLLIGHTSVFNTADIKSSLSLVSGSHSYNKWSIVWPVVPQGHIGVSIILNQCKYDLMLPCPVTMHVKFWVMFNFIFSLSATIGKYSFVIFPFVVWSYSICHFSTLLLPSSLVTTLFGTFL